MSSRRTDSIARALDGQKKPRSMDQAPRVTWDNGGQPRPSGLTSTCQSSPALLSLRGRKQVWTLAHGHQAADGLHLMTRCLRLPLCTRSFPRPLSLLHAHGRDSVFQVLTPAQTDPNRLPSEGRAPPGPVTSKPAGPPGTSFPTHHPFLHVLTFLRVLATPTLYGPRDQPAGPKYGEEFWSVSLRAL